jgi:hypothetical protein
VAGEIKLTAKSARKNTLMCFCFHVVQPASAVKGTVAIFDPVGESSALLKSLGYTVAGPGRVVWCRGTLVIGRKVLSNKHTVPAGLQQFVQNGGRLLVMAQEPRWMEYALGLRTSPHVARRVYRINNEHPVVSGLTILTCKTGMERVS